jgi:formylglycine-generating enzyme required for sulfatase activity
VAWVLACVAASAAAIGEGVARRGAVAGARCGRGFAAVGPRCALEEGACPAPLQRTAGGCDAPDVRVAVPACAIALGPSDWEAEGRVAPRIVRVTPFRIDAFEATRGQYERYERSARASADEAGPDAGARDEREPRRVTTEGLVAASGLTRDEAAAYCASRGGRLPTEDEWLAAAASAANPARRYPWGDTGAVCRRGAWGLAAGPCASSAVGPDAVGAHPDGDSPLGLHDVAGNVAEWVAPEPIGPGGAGGTGSVSGRAADGVGTGVGTAIGTAKGGSWASALATDLRTWAKLELDPAAHDPRVGVRCAYPP